MLNLGQTMARFVGGGAPAGGGAPESLASMVAAGRAVAVNPTTGSGYSRYDAAGKLFLPPTTNVCPDPQGVLADGTLWPASTANTSATANQAMPITAPVTELTKCLKLVNNGTADTPATATMTVVAAKSYYTSLFIYAPEVGGNVTITAEDGHTFVVALITAAGNGWVRYGVYSPTVAGEVTLHLHIAFTGGTQSTIYITGGVCAQDAGLTPFFCGLSTNCSWTGTANASTSTRPQVQVYGYPFVTSGTGTIAISFWPIGYRVNDGITSVYTAAGSVEATDIRFKAINQMRAYIRTGTTDDAQGPTSSIVMNAANTIVVRWTAGASAMVTTNGTNGAAALDLTGKTPLSSTAIVLAMLGTVSATQEYSGFLKSAIYSSAAKDAAWVTAISASSGAAFNDPLGLYNNYLASGDLLIPLATDTVAYRKVS